MGVWRYDTGRFAGKGKLTFLKVLGELDSDNDKVHALSQLVEAEQLSEATINVIESIIRLSVIFASHRIDKCSRCKFVAFQEEIGAI